MTVCIAAVCEGGKQAVCATDGLLSLGGITADTMLSKMRFINEWLFMYAGTPSQSQLIFEEISFVHKEIGEPLNRENIQGIVREAYRRRRGEISSAPILGPFGLSLEKFLHEGRAIFGDQKFQRLVRKIETQARYFNEQLLVVGWGAAERACMLYEIGPYGDSNHASAGVAAIGSGAEVAMSTLLLLGQSRESTLTETLYAVAAAKFAAEKSEEEAVGRNLAMYICEKYRGGDLPPGKAVQKPELDRLRKAWELYGRPRISTEFHNELAAITNAIGYPAHIRAKRVMSFTRSATQKSEG